MRALENIFWLGTKEFRSLFSDVLMVVFIVWSFSFAIVARATGIGETVNNASIAFVDEDNSALSRRLSNALFPPYFKRPTSSRQPMSITPWTKAAICLSSPSRRALKQTFAKS